MAENDNPNDAIADGAPANGPAPTGQATPIQEDRGNIIEQKMNVARMEQIKLKLGGLNAEDMAQLAEYAKSMALSQSLVPAFCRNKIWTCFGIAVQAFEWKLSPYSLAKMAYEVENRRTHEKTVAYMSQVHHAILEARQVLKERLRVRFDGVGDDMTCTVWGTFKDETEPREWTSERLGDLRPVPQQRFDHRSGQTYETTAGSPLWQRKPKVQLFYDTSRDWGRIYCPDVVMGIYTDDEMQAAGFTTLDEQDGASADDISSLTTRLSESALARAGRGQQAQLPPGQAVAMDIINAEHVAETVDAVVASRNLQTSAEEEMRKIAAGHALGSDGPADTTVAETGEASQRAPKSRRSRPGFGGLGSPAKFALSPGEKIYRINEESEDR